MKTNVNKQATEVCDQWFKHVSVQTCYGWNFMLILYDWSHFLYPLCSHLLTFADIGWHLLTFADICSHLLKGGSQSYKHVAWQTCYGWNYCVNLIWLNAISLPPLFIFFHIGSHLLTFVHIGSDLIPFVHTCSHLFTFVNSYSHLFTFAQIYSH